MGEIQELEWIIMPDGRISVKVFGVKGKDCLKVTKPFEEVLGNEILSREFTDECECEEEVNLQNPERIDIRKGK